MITFLEYLEEATLTHGSEKQIAWAEKIIDYEKENKSAWIRPIIKQYHEWLDKLTDAKWIIDNRDHIDSIFVDNFYMDTLEKKIHTVPKEQHEALFAELKKRLVSMPSSKDVKKRFEELQKKYLG